MTKQSKTIEETSANLVRVLKKIRRKGNDGKTKEHKQAYYVHKAAPGDRYQSAPQGAQNFAQVQPPQAAPENPDQGQEQDPEMVDQPQGQDLSQPIDPNAPQAADPNAQMQQPPLPPMPPPRVTVGAYEIPWSTGAVAKYNKVTPDPIPPEVRKRFSGDLGARQFSPVGRNAPLVSVTPSDSMLWDSNETDILARMRTGRVMAVRSVGATSGTMLVKIESSDGTRHKAYLRVEGLVDPFYYECWGKEYGLKQEDGAMSMRSAAAYEVSKAIGLDDIVPPTTARYEQYGDLKTIVPATIIERIEESIAAKTGEKPDTVRDRISGFASVQMVIPETHGIDKERWFSGIFQRKGEVSDALNRFFSYVPEDIRVFLLRAAALDFVLWTGDRHLLDYGFTGNSKHRLLVLGNSICLPDPRQTLERYVNFGGGFLDKHPIAVGGYPMLWSDILLMLAIRGEEQDLAMYESIGVEISNHLSFDTAINLARALKEHGVPHVSTAAAIIRAKMLGKASRTFARNPFAFLDICSQMVIASGEPSPLANDFAVAVDFANKAMSNAVGSQFDFASELAAPLEEEDEEDESNRRSS